MFKFYVLLVPLVTAYGAVIYTLTPNPGDNVTLPCFYGSASAKHLCWYKQVAGAQPQIMSSFYTHSADTSIFHNQFKDDRRFSIDSGEGFYHLNISNVQESDSALYYCGQISFTATEFEMGIFLVLKESNRRSFLQQPASDTVEPGGSVTLNCMVQTGTSDGEHSVYWFKKDSRDSRVGIMYVHARSSSSSQCVKSPESPAQSCVYSLSKRNVSLSDAGTYYCAVASCGEILFGNGTRLDVGEKCDDVSSVPMLCVIAALFVSVTLNVIGVLCKLCKGKSPLSESQVGCSSPSAANSKDSQNTGSLYYAALSVNLHKRSRKQSDQTWSECVYYCVKG